MDVYNANNSKNKDLRGWNSRRSDEQDVVMTSSGIPLVQIFVSKVICIFKKSVNNDVVGIMVTSESNTEIALSFNFSKIFQIIT